MRIIVTIPVERELEFGSVTWDNVTATADVDLANENNPVSWISVERDGVAVKGDELAKLTAPLSGIEDAVITEAMLRRSALAKSVEAERSVA